jgi:STE24 endopeptidase
MYTIIFWIIIVFLLADVSLGAWLDYLNRKSASSPIPSELEGIYDDEKYHKQQNYFIANNKFGTISNLFDLGVMLSMLFFFGFGFIDGIARNLISFTGTWGDICTGLIFFGILYFANEILTLPFHIYDTFGIEQRFGFNKTTPRLFISDTIKEWIVSAFVGGIIIGLLMLFYIVTENYFWILGWGVISIFSICAMMFYSTLIVPLFNKQTPLEKGELRTAIEDFCKKTDFKLDNLYVMDSSKRSTKANAYFSGLGAKKRIVLFDTLISTLTTEEIVAVLAHEIGHYKHKHTKKMLIFNICYFGFMFFILSLFLKYSDFLATALGGKEGGSFWLSMIAFFMLFSPITTLTGVVINVISRKNEYQADAFAKKQGLGKPLIEALKKLSSSTLSNLTPHPYYIFFHYSHPSLYQRIRALK